MTVIMSLKIRRWKFLIGMIKANIFPLAILLLFMALPLQAATVRLAWDASVSERVTGYKVYAGQASRIYGAPVIIGNQLTYMVTDLTPGIWFFAVSAFDADGNESNYSNEVSTAIGNSANRCDLNGDGRVDTLDLQALVNFILHGTPQISGDINADSKVNVLDLQILANVILGRQSCPGQ
jgi:hypothetical protein